MSINAGYMGVGVLGGKYLRFSDASVSSKQEINAPDLVMGDWDHNSFNYGAITIDGAVNGPLDEVFAADDGILKDLINRGDCGMLTENQFDLYYYCDTGSGQDSYFSHAMFEKVLANSVTLNATAGEVANYSINFIGAGEATYDTSPTPSLTETRKLITWDQLNVTLTGNDSVVFAASPLISAFELTIANNVTAVYSLGQDNLYPAALIPGIRTITGSITVYNMPQNPNTVPDKWAEYSGFPGNTGTGYVTFDLASTTVTVACRWARINPTTNPGPVTSTIAFTGIGHQSGSIW